MDNFKNTKVRKLESELKIYKKFTFLGFLLIIVAFITLGFTISDTSHKGEIIKAKGIALLDDNGNERILIGAPIPESEDRLRSDSAVGMIILNKKGIDRLVVGAPTANPQVKGEVKKRIAESTGIAINSKEGNERGGFGILEYKGSERVVLGLDHKNNEGLSLMLSDRYNGLILRDTNRTQRAFLGYDAKQSETVFNIDDQNGYRRLILKAVTDSTASIEVRDEQANSILTLPRKRN